ncbi:hypothetical protein, partial [Lactiplantibacillus plantarum]|uniref:hypothetical protein n=1 Tax=Lactiplantibacillus plantarum TaxID=1590 RepID=UPI001C9DBA9A
VPGKIPGTDRPESSLIKLSKFEGSLHHTCFFGCWNGGALVSYKMIVSNLNWDRVDQQWFVC